MRLLLVFLLSLSLSCVSNQKINTGSIFLEKTDFLYYTDDERPYLWRELPIKWTFVSSFPQKFRPHAREGFEHWERMTGIDLFIEIPDTNVLRDGGIRSAAMPTIVVTWSNGLSKINEKRLGEAKQRKRIDGEIFFSYIRYYKPWFKTDEGKMLTTARHEVGHALGFSHVGYSHKDCLMYTFITDEKDGKIACEREIEIMKEAYAWR